LSMARHHSPWGKQTRQRVALEAARIMSEEHLNDFSRARQKAAERLGITTRNDMPTNQEIEFELRSYRSIFSDESVTNNLVSQRQAALEAMKFFRTFKPRLVGSVLDGTAGVHDAVQLHLFSDLPEDFILFLMENSVDFDQRDETVRYKSGKTQTVPCFYFHAGDTPFQIFVFPMLDIRQAPLSSVSGSSMKRAGIDEVRSLITD
ncbi:MAG: hypothetical protein OEX19_09755, partial [Gammaproteobacteria bacterium]|nr:hypothetical protein [Gammaproteobacteria bacterium]